MTGALLRTPVHRVEPQRIPEALRTIWHDCRAAAEQAVSRALTHNFIAVVEAARAGELQRAIDELAGRRPCRAFFVVGAAAATGLEVEVTGTVRPQGNMTVLLLERIDIRSAPGSFDHVPGIVRPLLVNDIPTHLYWSCISDDGIGSLEAMAQLADHCIVDSARCADPARTIAAVEDMRCRGSCVTDLTWLRLRPWRRALAEGFERVHHDPGRAFTAVVHHGGRGAAMATLLARWLGQRLGAACRLEPTGTADDGLLAIELRSAGDSIQARAVAQGWIAVEVETAEACFLPFTVPASRGSEADLLAAAIDLY